MTQPPSFHDTPVPGSAVRGRLSPSLALIARLTGRLRRGTLHLSLPGRPTITCRGSEDGPEADLTIHSGRLARRYFLHGSVGVADAYVAGEWETSDLPALLELLDRNHEAWESGYYGSIASRALRRLGHRLRDNTKEGSRRNIHAHYDLGNEFFRAWLDREMLYSAALFEDDAQDLDTAQAAKCRRLARMIGLEPGHRLLEIGSGWGGFACMAAREFGARVTSITISRAQADLARERVREAGLEGQVEIRLQDYRDIEESFDRIASIEMFEAVGERHWPDFFGKLRGCLAPGGRIGLQLITIADPYFQAYRRSPDFIQRYIFPGGMLPSPSVLAHHYARAGLKETALHAFAQDYARTLAIWRDRFERAWPHITGQGFDERFRRLWRYYLAYCEAGFRSGSIDVRQTVLERA
ncbi:cyclopropane-fatty-acyl-phospholipid synthase family protein [Geminicoccaceae bacterium 1502E]|nr:cyclopropane-fatty-acyl-phospholipid synthase family protein [Geminicoccaceae bacterium 1502E]